MFTRGQPAFIRGCVVVLSLVVVACAAPSPASQASHGPVDCVKLARMGVKECPPANPQLAHPKLTNDTNGQVSNRQFRALVKAYLRTDAYEDFALRTNQPALLKADILSTQHAETLSFGGDLQELNQASAEAGYLGGQIQQLTSLRLVTLPASVQQGITEAGYQPSHLGWVATYSAPASGFIIAGSRFTVLFSASANANPVVNLKWGTLRTHTPLGSIWQYSGGAKCSLSPLWQTVCESS